MERRLDEKIEAQMKFSGKRMVLRKKPTEMSIEPRRNFLRNTSVVYHSQLALNQRTGSTGAIISPGSMLEGTDLSYRG